MSNRREATGGVFYEASALSEGPIRALSPGLNDPGTAMACINRLVEGLAFIASEAWPRGPQRYGEPPAEVCWVSTDVAGVVEHVLVPIAPHATRDAQVKEHAEHMLRRLRERCHEPADQAAVDAMLERLAKAAS